MQKWTDLVAQGTKEGAEEQLFFVRLTRHPKYTYRSVADLQESTSLPEERILEILKKYSKLGMIMLSPKNDMYGYWERVKEDYPEYFEKELSLSQKDKRNRINKITGFSS